jgi:hypothetical protein
MRITVSTTLYERTHGDKPCAKEYGRWSFRVGQTEVSCTGMYPEALKVAKQEARRVYQPVIVVLP